MTTKTIGKIEIEIKLEDGNVKTSTSFNLSKAIPIHISAMNMELDKVKSRLIEYARESENKK